MLLKSITQWFTPIFVMYSFAAVSLITYFLSLQCKQYLKNQHATQALQKGQGKSQNDKIYKDSISHI